MVAMWSVEHNAEVCDFIIFVVVKIGSTDVGIRLPFPIPLVAEPRGRETDLGGASPASGLRES
jgi:hypothetical protein